MNPGAGEVALNGVHAAARARVGFGSTWLPGPRRVRVDAAGAWHLQQPGGSWLVTVPDQLAVGPGGLWLRLAGSVCARSSRAPHTVRRVRATLWRAHFDADAWRRLQVAARWRAAHSRHEGRA